MLKFATSSTYLFDTDCYVSDGKLFLGCAEYSMQDQRLQKHSFAPRGNNTDKSSSGQSKPKSKGNALLPWYSNAPRTSCWNCLV